MRFNDEPLITIVRHLREALAAGSPLVQIEVPDPDLGRGRYAGERVGLEGELIHRPLRAWCDLAEGLGCRLLTPRALDGTHIELRFEALGPEAEWHMDGRGRQPDERRERYGAGSSFARVRKFEDPAFLLPFVEALGRIPLHAGDRVLDLGVNRGDELAAFAWLPGVPELSFVGVDHSPSVLAEARRRFPGPAWEFIEADLNALPKDLGKFSLVLSIGTLQSPGVDDRELLRRLVQRHLTPDAAVVLGFPNCRYRDGEVVYGARIRNLREPDLSLAVKDLSFYRRYLHQHGFRTFLTGKYELLLTAVRGGSES
ncbi:MAG: class I SAM-dependent methyltransferase [Myxococcaceae bacterium]